MSEKLTMAQLRQNPAPALREVAEGKSFVITNHGKPVADMVPHRERRRVTPDQFHALLRKPMLDTGWSEELTASRSELADDPWEQ